MTLSTLDWMIIAGYFAVSVLVGVRFTRRSGRSTEEYFLGGRRIPWWLAGVSIVATTFSSDTPLLVTGITARGGIAGNWILWTFALSGMLTVFFFARLWHRAGVTTDVEFAAIRYSGRPAHLADLPGALPRPADQRGHRRSRHARDGEDPQGDHRRERGACRARVLRCHRDLHDARRIPGRAVDRLRPIPPRDTVRLNPDIILARQLDKLKGDKVAELKAAGVEYDERMAELEKLEYPKPLRDFVYQTFNAFADRHPWVGEENIHPKSIAREMFEQFRSFAEYVLDYELQRSEGLLLRHLNSVYKVLSQTVPDGVRSDEVQEMELYFRTLIRDVDSSLEVEWKRMRDPDYAPLRGGGGARGVSLRPPGADEGLAAQDVTRDTRAFTTAVRTRAFTFLRAWSIGQGHAGYILHIQDIRRGIKS